jgi:3-hydroxybutyryl-CoA dehydratase
LTSRLADLVEPHRGIPWRDLTVGWAFRTSARTITEADLTGFVNAAGFAEPLFLDARPTPAARPVPAVLTLGYAEGLVMQSRVFHGTGVALLKFEMDVKAPLRAGDTITVAVEINEISPTSDGERALVSTINSVIDQDERLIMEYRPLRLQR